MQFKVLLTRYFKSYWRSPPYNTTRLILAVVSGLIFGSFFFDKGNTYDTPQDINNVLGALFLTTTFSGFINFQVSRWHCHSVAASSPGRRRYPRSVRVHDTRCCIP